MIPECYYQSMAFAVFRYLLYDQKKAKQLCRCQPAMYSNMAVVYHCDLTRSY